MTRVMRDDDADRVDEVASNCESVADLADVGQVAARLFGMPELARIPGRDADAATVLGFVVSHAHRTLFRRRLGVLWEAERELIIYFDNHPHALRDSAIAKAIAVLTEGGYGLTVEGSADDGYTVAIALAGGTPELLAEVREIFRTMHFDAIDELRRGPDRGLN